MTEDSDKGLKLIIGIGLFSAAMSALYGTARAREAPPTAPPPSEGRAYIPPVDLTKHYENIAQLEADRAEAERLYQEALRLQEEVAALQEMVQPTTEFDPAQLTPEQLAEAQALADISRPAFSALVTEETRARARRARERGLPSVQVPLRPGQLEAAIAQQEAALASLSGTERARIEERLRKATVYVPRDKDIPV